MEKLKIAQGNQPSQQAPNKIVESTLDHDVMDNDDEGMKLFGGCNQYQVKPQEDLNPYSQNLDQQIDFAPQIYVQYEHLYHITSNRIYNELYSEGQRISAIVDMTSNPRKVVFYVDDIEQPNFVIRILSEI
ncbi:MAG: hypothetical protein EZS28_000986 [Streblomastix strix]|uniref:Uncharacterized protein n=1 Tax=Streblomastix strix TaxID=222440 RepID=A0A5J4X8C4_9EUKA|nr:MAG: hypothetical protein EZS28_000986 [Streblomastix strix]